MKIRKLDAQDTFGKTIFGAGYLLSERCEELKAAAEREVKAAEAAVVWKLSDREEMMRKAMEKKA